MLLNKISWVRLIYNILLQALGLYAIYYTFITSQYYLFAAALLIMLLTQFTIYAHYHMVVTHGSWKFNYKWIDHIFSVIGIVQGMGSPIPWAVVHRLHHKYVDTVDDPHSPQHLGLFITQFHGWKTPDIVNARVPKKDLIKNFSHLKIYNSKTAISLVNILGWLSIYGLFGFNGIMATALGLALTSNNLGLTNGWIHRLGDKYVDKPNLFWWSLFLGSPEAYFHREHHDKPFKYSHTKSIFEWHARLVELFQYIGLATINEKKMK